MRAGSRFAIGANGSRELDVSMYDVLNVAAVAEGKVGDIRIQRRFPLERRHSERSAAFVEVSDEAEIAHIGLAL